MQMVTSITADFLWLENVVVSIFLKPIFSKSCTCLCNHVKYMCESSISPHKFTISCSPGPLIFTNTAAFALQNLESTLYERSAHESQIANERIKNSSEL